MNAVTGSTPSSPSNRYPCEGCKGLRAKCNIYLFIGSCDYGLCSLGTPFLRVASEYTTSKAMKTVDINEGLVWKVAADCNAWSVRAAGQASTPFLIDVGRSILRCEGCKTESKPCDVVVSCERCLKPRKRETGVRECVADKQLKLFVDLLVREALTAATSHPHLQRLSGSEPPAGSRYQFPLMNAHTVSPSEVYSTRNGTAMSCVLPQPSLTINVPDFGGDCQTLPITPGPSQSTLFQRTSRIGPSHMNSAHQHYSARFNTIPSAVVEDLDTNPDALLNSRYQPDIACYATPSTCDGAMAPEVPATIPVGSGFERNQYKPTCIDNSMLRTCNFGVHSPSPGVSPGNNYLTGQTYFNDNPETPLDGSLMYSPGHQFLHPTLADYDSPQIFNTTAPSDTVVNPAQTRETLSNRYTLESRPELAISQIIEETRSAMANNLSITEANFYSPKGAGRNETSGYQSSTNHLSQSVAPRGSSDHGFNTSPTSYA